MDAKEEDQTKSDEQEREFTDSSETGLRSGKGNGFLRRLLFG